MLTLFVALMMLSASSSSGFIGGTAWYCNGCNLGSVPAVGSISTYTSNHSSTFYAKKQQIYYYTQGVTECSVGSQTRVNGLNSICRSVFGQTTARCHLLDDGTSPANCWADWECSPCVRPELSPTRMDGPGVVSVRPPAIAGGVLDTATATWLSNEDAEAPASSSVGSHVLADARRLGALPTGRSVFLVPTRKGELCVVVSALAESCGQPLSSTSPITFTMIDPDGAGGDPLLAFGYAQSNVRSVSFTVAGKPQVVTVSPDQMFVYRDTSGATIDDFSAPTVTLSDGTTRLAL
jgi:hypothetical protein